MVQWARDHNVNCLEVGDDASHFVVATIAANSSGGTDLVHRLSTDDLANYTPPILQPVRQCLAQKTAFYYCHHSLPFSEEQSLFDHGANHSQSRKCSRATGGETIIDKI
jgi:hypothetical protein